jgi:hypothetical protein
MWILLTNRQIIFPITRFNLLTAIANQKPYKTISKTTVSITVSQIHSVNLSFNFTTSNSDNTSPLHLINGLINYDYIIYKILFHESVRPHCQGKI